MYTTYFGLREQPFSITPNPRFFYANPGHEEAYANLLYGIQERKGCIVLIGEAGTGKTTLLRRVMENQEETVRTAFLFNTTLTFDELLDFLCHDFALPVPEGQRLAKIQALNQFLLTQLQDGGTAVLLIDEAQNLSDEILENLRLLSNFETARAKLLQIVLVGQPELDKKLERPELRQLKQRIAIRCHLDRLKARDVGPFIYHRLHIAGCDRHDVFTPEAVQRIAIYSRGIPRLINILCDNALLIAYGTGVHTVAETVIEEVAQDLRLKREEVRLARSNPVEDVVLWRTSPAGQEVTNKTAAVQTIESVAAMATVDGQEEMRQAVAAGFAPVWGKRLLWVATITVVVFFLRVGGVKLSPPQTTARNVELSVISSPAPTEPKRSEPGIQDRIPPAANLSSQSTVEQQADGRSEETPQSLSSPAPTDSHGSGEQGQLITIARGNTISEIVLKMYGSHNALAFDLIKEFNPQLEDLDRIAVGDQVWLPFLTRDTLLRKQADGSYHFIVGAFHSEGEADRSARAARRRGYSVLISKQKISGTHVLHRVEIEKLQDLAAVDRVWSLVEKRT
jgi:general secretion pathway protein A